MSIATFIKQDLIAGIRSGEIKSERLTLDALSKRYSVNATPVRIAVRELIERSISRRVIMGDWPFTSIRGQRSRGFARGANGLGAGNSQ